MEKIPVSWLHKQAYCEYSIYLEHIKDVKAEPTTQLLEGSKKHMLLEERHKELAEITLSMPDAIAKARCEGIPLTTREVPVEGSNLIGVIDEVLIMPNQVCIIDDKPGQRAYLSNRRQVLGYCLAFEEHYKPGLPIVAVLRDRDTGKAIWSKPFEELDRCDILDSISRIRAILNGQSKGQTTRNPAKCRSCRLKAFRDVGVNR